MKAYRTAMVALTMAAATMMANGQDKAEAAQSYFSSRASYSAADVDRATKNYVACLKSGNDGVIESALAHVALMKLASPEKEFTVLQEAVALVAVSAKSQETRYKAFLVKMAFDSPAMFAGETQKNHQSNDELFGSMASIVARTLLASQEK